MSRASASGVSIDTDPRGGALEALRRLLPILVFAALPLVTVVSMFVVAIDTGPIALDFHQELYPQAKALLAGRNPYPGAIWPPVAAGVAAPFTVFPPSVADVLVGVAGIVCIAGSLRLVGVRDWRVYGVAALWPQVIGEIRISHLTPLLCLLLALAWKHRDATLRPGLALGLAAAIKFFVWPVAVWFLATRRTRPVVIAGVAVTLSLLLVLPFTGLDDYADTLLGVSRAFDQDSYSLFGLLSQLGVGEAAARVIAVGVGASLLLSPGIAATSRSRSRRP